MYWWIVILYYDDYHDYEIVQAETPAEAECKAKESDDWLHVHVVLGPFDERPEEH